MSHELACNTKLMFENNILYQNFEHDKALLKERLRKVKENEKRLEREKKRLDIENEKNQKKLKELNNIIQTKEIFEK